MTEIWLADVDAAGPVLDQIEVRFALLSHDERARRARMASVEVGRRWTRSRVVLRLVLGRHVGADHARDSFEVAANGKPALARSSLQFSISHSGGLVLVGLDPIGPIGIDLEICRDVTLSGLRRTAIERVAHALAPDATLPEEPHRRFVQAWTRLEALAKASGQGVGRVLETLGTRKLGAGPVDTERVNRALASGSGALRIHDLDLGREAVAAVATRHRGAPTVLAFPDAPTAIESFMRPAPPC